MAMEFSKEYFALQLSCTERVAGVCSLSFEEALLNHTNLYLQFVDRSFDPAHPTWRAYLAGLSRAQDRAMWTATFYRARKELAHQSPYGCFSYSYYADEKTVRIHFSNADASGYGALSWERRPIRLQELKSLFVAIQSQQPDAEWVRGGSWLYNLAAYRALFPPQFLATARPIGGEMQYMSLWGQFLRRDGQLREAAASTFLSNLHAQNTLEGIEHCFPCQVLRPECSIAHFYEFYGKVDV